MNKKKMFKIIAAVAVLAVTAKIAHTKFTKEETPDPSDAITLE